MPEILNITRGQIMADRRAYTVTVRYPGERPMHVTFVGPSVDHGPVTIGFAGITTTVVHPDRFGPFGRAWIFRFYGVLGHADTRPCGALTGWESKRVGDVTCPDCRDHLVGGEAYAANARSL